MPDHPTLTYYIAAAIRKHSPGALPEAIGRENGCLTLTGKQTDGLDVDSIATLWLPDDITRHVLIAAMLCGGQIYRDVFGDSHCWTAWQSHDRSHLVSFDDKKDGNNDPLLSLFAAWKFSKGIK